MKNLRYIKVIDYVQYVYKSKFNIEKSKTQIKEDLKNGTIKLNNIKLNVNDYFKFFIED